MVNLKEKSNGQKESSKEEEDRKENDQEDEEEGKEEIVTISSEPAGFLRTLAAVDARSES